MKGGITMRKNRKITRRDFLYKSAFATSFITLASQFTSCQKSVGPKPNIVLIFTDDLGYGDLGCYGNTVTKTPNIDRLASGGVRFTDFYVASSVCGPSRASLLTGRYPQRNGIYENIRNNMVNYGYRYSEYEYSTSPEMTLGLDLREITIADVLKKAGYTTGIIGKWDSGRARRFLPLQRGFDFFYGFANTGIDYWTHERYGVPSMFRGNERIKEEGYATDLFRREAVQFIKNNKDRPFLLYVPFNAPHGPSNLEHTGPQAPDEYIRMYGEPPGDNKIRLMANITCMDAAVGEILSVLKELDLEEDTIVMFISDNGAGGGTNYPLRGGKGNLFDGGIREPFIAKWPGHIPEGTVSHEFCSTLEMFPTFLKIAGAKPPKDVILDGFNMLPVLTGERISQRQELFWLLRENKAARVGNWKWVESQSGGGLFNLSNDIGEQHDLSDEKPKVLKEIKAKWTAWKKEMDEAEPHGPFKNY